MLHDILDDDHIQWHPPLIRHYTNFWPLLFLMLASHCPDFSSRWTHDGGNVQHREWSWRHRVIRDCIVWSCDHRLSFLGFGSNFGSVHKIFGMSKNCLRSSRRCIVVWTSCVLLGHRVAIVSPSCRHPEGSRSYRRYFVWSSATPGFYSTRWQYDGHAVLADGLAMATRLREAFA